ncbi:Heat shock protein 15 [Roseomonas mucosa]|uniref:Heat shock protein 15 n=1 Tax=Roseomonas mucosa TaxID=207340 RepID=A0A1S8DBG9_9PROT|nr:MULTISPECIES: RNA-binding S4 domain-containing protein [Roseomonas]MBS5903459.1 RNA-binding S4 domain-containing protein [Acetobacteraceae bacterium]MDT8263311.1 RNA-binding S4 domain-containing protein [Roseomonas sp. DSM 102946]ATR20863.1 heat-shock protein [Roseomonas sp. FDAARGOS_362]AWV22593.1 Heat shock protein 15 [Roseomonas mucosa]MCG7350332.1 RNA-binding S4 domain-containing protein [Roseomonas mucosa]
MSGPGVGPRGGQKGGQEGQDWQRLDAWLWCARVAKTRAACSRLVEAGAVRLNRQPAEKAHARLRPGDVLTLALGGPEHGRIQVWRVLSLAMRRGPAPEARLLYEELAD